MTEILSFSADRELIDELEKARNAFGFSGRSETIRNAISTMLSDYKNKTELSGIIDAIILIIHNDVPEEISKVRHKFNSSIKTQIHNHLSNGKCLEILIVCDEAETVNQMLSSFRKNKKIGFVKLVVP